MGVSVLLVRWRERSGWKVDDFGVKGNGRGRSTFSYQRSAGNAIPDAERCALAALANLVAVPDIVKEGEANARCERLSQLPTTRRWRFEGTDARENLHDR
jgi:hypothetical protein